MRNQILTTLNCNIDSIQLKLSDFFTGKNDFETILNDRLKPVKNTQNINQKLYLHENNHFEYINLLCPYCGSKNVIKQEYRQRKLLIDDKEPLNVYLRRYLCKTCGRKFTTNIKSIIKPYKRYINLFKDKLECFLETGYRSLRKTQKDLQNFLENSPSHQTIRNWLTINNKNMIKNTERFYSGYYTYDEQFLRINGHRMYRLTLYDQIRNIPIAEQIVPKRTPQAITQFIEESTINQPLISVTTDHMPLYKNIMDYIGVKHQLCVFHLFKMIGDKLYKKLRSKKVTEREKISLCLYFTDIKNIFRTYNSKTSQKRLEKLLNDFNRIPRLLQRFIKQKIIPDYKRLTTFMENNKIPRTSNTVENYYRQTEPEQIKKKYKTKKGILTYLHYKMKNWTKKHIKK
ncbi:transposase family protein [Methanobacterium alkalithermotolerans]|uniref:Transposase family protein n=1 Tax=Methanobacterium alkalithermotolerans TaxID=2731220 RepID=A0A8T8K499_9EURY|nr:transposase family protein [Methanobacterium alkalithermotolerans]QUH22420.1 transposase family protein [Methanobacterium alkalithermotolerans]QUH22807.1 transposase family protein [Methanobacterium alkalithermotolerans]QUH23655.1 transposase family protein [Methanobacterium alkalithermotolerans]QUH23988.1 transposase family protein [Methanobacterium alkalithermotolerans]